MKKTIVISWGYGITRSSSLADWLEAVDIQLRPIFSYRYLKVLNYAISFVKTLYILCQARPNKVVVVMPPVFPLYAVHIYRFLFNRKLILICDLHNGALRREWKSWPYLGKLLKKSNTVLSHNTIVEKKINEQFNIKTKVLSDPLPTFDLISNVSVRQFLSQEKINVLVPVSYAKDEPISEIIFAAEALSKDFNFILTGNYLKQFNEKYAQGLTATFTGFISKDEYQKLLCSADLTLCLTLNDDIQMCAVIESISANKPFICSRNSVNEALFSQFYLNSIENHSASIVEAFNGLQLSSDIKVDLSAKKDYMESWKRNAKNVF